MMNVNLSSCHAVCMSPAGAATQDGGPAQPAGCAAFLVVRLAKCPRRAQQHRQALVAARQRGTQRCVPLAFLEHAGGCVHVCADLDQGDTALEMPPSGREMQRRPPCGVAGCYHGRSQRQEPRRSLCFAVAAGDMQRIAAALLEEKACESTQKKEWHIPRYKNHAHTHLITDLNRHAAGNQGVNDRCVTQLGCQMQEL